LLSDINDIKVTRVIQGAEGQDAVKVYEKNASQKVPKLQLTQEVRPDHERAPKEFIEMGGKGDETLYSEEDGGSRYATDQSLASAQSRGV
jgi:serine/threonine-protein kinase Chk2